MNNIDFDIPDADGCQTRCVHPERIATVRGQTPPLEVLAAAAELFKALADSTRVRILAALLAAPPSGPRVAGPEDPGQGELCVCDISALLDMSSSAVSHQLRVLRAAGLVRYRRAGKLAYYSLDDDHVTRLLAQALDHVGHGAGRVAGGAV